MSALLRAELLKLRTTRTFAALVGSALALSLLVVGLTTAAQQRPVARRTSASCSRPTSAACSSCCWASWAMAGEWRHKTITSTFLAAPDRLRLLAAKTLSYAARRRRAVADRDPVDHGRRHADPVRPRGDHRGRRRPGRRPVAQPGRRRAVRRFGVCIGAVVRNQVVAIVGLLVFTVRRGADAARLSLTTWAGTVRPLGAQRAPRDPAHGDEEQLAPAVALLVMSPGWRWASRPAPRCCAAAISSSGVLPDGPLASAGSG